MYEQFDDKKLEEILLAMELSFSRGEMTILQIVALRKYLGQLLPTHN